MRKEKLHLNISKALWTTSKFICNHSHIFDLGIKVTHSKYTMTAQPCKQFRKTSSHPFGPRVLEAGQWKRYEHHGWSPRARAVVDGVISQPQVWDSYPREHENMLNWEDTQNLLLDFSLFEWRSLLLERPRRLWRSRSSLCDLWLLWDLLLRDDLWPFSRLRLRLRSLSNMNYSRSVTRPKKYGSDNINPRTKRPEIQRDIQHTVTTNSS